MIEAPAQPAIWSKSMPLPRAGGRRGVGPAWGELRALRGVVERIVYQGLDDGYVVARVTLDGTEDGRPDESVGADGFVTVAGTMPDVVVGEAIEARGWWKKEPRHGWTYRVVDYRTTLPATVHGIRRYLASGLVHGIGPVIAGRIVDLFGGDTLAVIDGVPERLREVPGVGPVRAERVAAAWSEHRQVHEVMVALQSYGVSTGLAARIYRKYKQNSVRVMTDDPFRLAREVVGIGFKTADKIARSIGVAPNAPERVRSAVVHALRELALRGDTQVDEAKLAEHATQLLGTEDAPVLEAIRDLVSQRQIVQAGELVADAKLAAAEAAVAERLLRLRDREGKTLLGHASAQRAWASAFSHQESQLTEEQDRAVTTALTKPVSIITGGPGTGKTFALKAILEAAEAVGARVLLAAPTGRAAQRMKEATGRDARTIHRLLDLRPGGSGWRGAGNVLPADCVVVDEASMVDVPLMHRLVRSVAPGAHLVLVGDPDQLPSVGPGNVLADLIASGRFPVTTLTHVFRHGAGSGIALAAREINRGRVPAPKASSGDYYFVSRAEPESAADTVVKLVAERIPAHLGCPPSQVQVLAPMHRGAVGVGALNARLQAALNPRRDGASELRANGRVFREGDRVMQLRNDYTRNVFNGDMGLVERVNAEEGNLAVRFEDERLASYAAGDLWMLTHSWCVSVHKCVAGHERVWTANRGLVPIREVRPGDVVQTGDHSRRRVLDAVATGRRRVVRMRTRYGYQIDVSAEHPILVADGAPPRFVNASQVTPGQYACIARSPLDGGGPPSLPQPEPVGRADLRLPTQLTEELAWWLGVTVGDGSYRDRRDGTVDFTSQDTEILEKYERILREYGLRVGRYRREGRAATRLYAVSRQFRGWLLALGLGYATAKEKHVPDVIFRAPATCRAAFLRGLFDADGSASNARTRSCRLVTSSPRLAAEVQRLLLSLGIVSYASQAFAGAYWIGVSGTALEPFAREVGFTVAYKAERLRIALARPVGPRTTNLDRVPFSRALMMEVEAALKERWPRSQGIKGGRLSYRNLGEVMQYLERVGVTVPEALRCTAASGYFYDKIISIEPIDESVEMYDLEVEDVHSFVANGFVCHNSQGNEFRAVVFVAMTTHALALNRTLLYTALTRAKELAVVVGQEKAFEMGVDNWRWTERVTALGHLLGEPPAAVDAPEEDEESWEPYYVAEDEDAVWDVLARAQPRA